MKRLCQVYVLYLEMEKHGRLIAVWLVTYGLKDYNIIGRINGGEFQKFYESLPSWNLPWSRPRYVRRHPTGGLELGMFERVKKYSDIN